MVKNKWQNNNVLKLVLLQFIKKGKKMDIPQELKEAIETAITGTKHAELINESQKISEKYRENDGKGKRLVTEQSEAIAYAISRMPSTYCAVYSVLSHSLKNYDKSIKNVIDIGAGTGAASWAVSNVLDIEKITCLEREKAMRDIGMKLMNQHVNNVEWREFDLIIHEFDEKADLVITSYVINELNKSDREKAILKMWQATNDLLVIIEPGTPEGFKHILEAREILLAQNANIIAPCAHNGKCAINPEEDWCSFYVRVARSGIHRQAKKGELGYEDEKFCYIAFSKEAVCTNENRILRHPQINSGYVKVKLCTQNGIEEKTYSKKDKELYKRVKKLDAGDTI